ncbi:hypothetical protein [Sphingobacterium siyangense]|jgi:hypothetical protein|uniref:hypothetical protein n=1 Tax=Sphingobacterium siyangense TaxID=459529 RepID=UPI0028A93DF6|nr:hypothetical protein [Sphingobacterium siyangense]
MTNNLKLIDDVFITHYRKLLEIQRNVFNECREYNFDLNSNEITQAIHDRMSAFWDFHVYNAKQILDRKINTGGADFFTETCLLFLKAYFEQKYNVIVTSEKSLLKKGNSMRPDISIWTADYEEVLAVVELKVNDGWKGKNIMAHLRDREEKIKILYPNSYFGVIAFWNFFDESDLNLDWRNKYVGLYRYDRHDRHEKTNGYVEDIMKSIELTLPAYLLKEKETVAV